MESVGESDRERETSCLEKRGNELEWDTDIWMQRKRERWKRV